ncbi:replication endonuclease [Marinomonas foliarum]|uniref:Bacteriophage replication gene A protein n=1 Tax=Marinomonas foliarum TaxID=491950 RepID=A0A369ACY0_9GAMM|nr:replication endonuclease [Marinomonas foliarum]RCX07041.1 bacteriophage replication gene A protein [Marinomonas foliarum]
MNQPTKECIKWRSELLDGLSPQDVGYLTARLDELDRAKGYVESNSWLRGAIKNVELISRLSVTGMRETVLKEAERRQKREGQAVAYAWVRSVVDRLFFCDEWITDLTGDKLANWANEKSRRFEMSSKGLQARKGLTVFDYVKKEAEAVNANFNQWDDAEKVEALMLRMCTPEWWARQAKRHYRAVENIRRECGQVCNQQSPYVSRWGINRYRKQRQANRAFLESWEAINQHEQSFLLSELADKSISNPIHNKAELSVRIRGLQYLAVQSGHEARFITITCPSKYHPVHKDTGFRNRKFYAFGCPSPREAQQYLNKQWAKIRAAYDREGIKFYGIRTVEPHHDGTPHWHLILFVAKNQSARLLEIAEEYALEVDGHEQGADKSRFDEILLDPEKGGAVAYVAKYIAKNIDGKDANGKPLEILDEETGRTFVDSAERVQAWKARHGIRQFQFLGASSVTVWREIRRLKDSIPKAFSEIYTAAVANDWKRFSELMGSGKGQALRPFYEQGENNQFGEPTMKIKGLWNVFAEYVPTRLFEWTIQRVGAGALSLGAAEPFPRNRVNNCTGGVAPPYQVPIYQ